MSWVSVGTVGNLDVDRIRAVRERLRSRAVRARRDVWDADQGRMVEPDATAEVGAALAAPVTETALVERSKWQGWAMLLGGVLLGLLVAAAAWWYGKSTKAEAKSKAKAARSRALTRTRKAA